MQGKKHYQEKLFLNFQLSDRIPENNFYRRLKAQLDLSYLYATTADYYGDCGQKSIDPVVFMKLMLVGYLENICSDRRLISHCGMRIDILYFLGYDIDEELPWHSTLSRTRALLPEPIFVETFERVLQTCVDKGMVGGKNQSIDSAPVKANASLDSLAEKQLKKDLAGHIRKVKNEEENDDWTPKRPSKEDKSTPSEREIAADDRTLQQIKKREENWSNTQKRRPGNNDPRSKYISNKTHYSPVDPDARISVKPGKARKLNYQSQLAVDDKEHVITHIAGHYADKNDNQSLAETTDQLHWRLRRMGLVWKNLLADTGYSSGENYAYIERKGLMSYIPAHGQYKGGPEGFTYQEQGDYWECSQGIQAAFKQVIKEKSRTSYGKGYLLKKRYLTKGSDCKGCPIKSACIGKRREKKIEITYYKQEYDRAIARVNSGKGQYYKRKRSSTVEPVFGILTQFMGMAKVYTRGLDKANKCMLMSATAYNLKKLLNRKVKPKKLSAEKVLQKAKQQLQIVIDQIGFILSQINPPKMTNSYW
jgi:transposase